MKKNILTVKFKITIILLIFLSPFLTAQSRLGVGINFGGGSMSGNFLRQGAFTSSIFVEANPGFVENFQARLSFIYISDVNILLPQSNGRYNSFIKGFSLKGITSQSLSGNLYVEEGLGPIILNDRTLGYQNKWDLGVAFSVIGGFDLRDDKETGFKVGIGVEYGLTFTNTDVSYISLHLHAQYSF